MGCGESFRVLWWLGIWQSMKLLHCLAHDELLLAIRAGILGLFFMKPTTQARNCGAIWGMADGSNLMDGEALTLAFAGSGGDYKDVRPHGSLDGLTPGEAYQGLGRETLHAHEVLKAAQKLRIGQNRRNKCQKCQA